MTFIMPELVVESVIREGLAVLVNRPEIIDNIFASLTADYNADKYGQRELNKIKKMIKKKEVVVVHNLSDVGSRVPCYSIQLGSDLEAKPEALLEDHATIGGEEEIPIEERIIEDDVLVLAYNENSGKMDLHPDTDLTDVNPGNLFVDNDGKEFTIRTVVKKGAKRKIFIDKGSDFNAANPTQILSSIKTKGYEEKAIISDEQVIIGIHSKDALTTKYLYIMLKYFLMSRKQKLIERCFYKVSFQGSDFTRDMRYVGDHVYHRFFTVFGTIEDTWNAEEAVELENAEINVLVEKDRADDVDLDKETHTVKPKK